MLNWVFAVTSERKYSSRLDSCGVQLRVMSALSRVRRVLRSKVLLIT